jgi:hypothetical protein
MVQPLVRTLDDPEAPMKIQRYPTGVARLLAGPDSAGRGERAEPKIAFASFRVRRLPGCSMNL